MNPKKPNHNNELNKLMDAIAQNIPLLSFPISPQLHSHNIMPLVQALKDLDVSALLYQALHDDDDDDDCNDVKNRKKNGQPVLKQNGCYSDYDFKYNVNGYKGNNDGRNDVRNNDHLNRCNNGAEAVSVLSSKISSSSSTMIISPIHAFIQPKLPKYYNNTNTLRYLHLGSSADKYSIGIFVFPPHTRMPLHDHPDMCVLSKLLYGSVCVKSYDWCDDNSNEDGWRKWWKRYWFNSYKDIDSNISDKGQHEGHAPKKRKAKLTQHSILKAPYTTILYPHQHNLHEFIAAGDEGAAILDILLPPYDEQCDPPRDCQYFKPSKDEDVEVGDELDLVELEGNDVDFHCVNGKFGSLG